MSDAVMPRTYVPADEAVPIIVDWLGPSLRAEAPRVLQRPPLTPAKVVRLARDESAAYYAGWHRGLPLRQWPTLYLSSPFWMGTFVMHPRVVGNVPALDEAVARAASLAGAWVAVLVLWATIEPHPGAEPAEGMVVHGLSASREVTGSGTLGGSPLRIVEWGTVEERVDHFPTVRSTMRACLN